MEQYIERIAVHSVGNKANGDAILLSSSELIPGRKYPQPAGNLLSPFKSEEYYNLYHESSLELNEAYNFVSRIFDDPQALHEQSVQLAKHLYEQSKSTPKSKGRILRGLISPVPVSRREVQTPSDCSNLKTKDTFLKISASAAGFRNRKPAGHQHQPTGQGMPDLRHRPGERLRRGRRGQYE